MSLEPHGVYIATYSNTDVYECQINTCPLMRRCKDDWVNATQILKCCNFPKAKRTKILEKGVQQGLHEKIQGGYGRFQGTWIPLPDALRLAGNYGLSPELAPVLYLDFSNLTIPRKVKPVGGSSIGKDGTPVKRKYTKKAKKEGDAASTTPSKKLKKSDLHLQLQQAQTISSHPSGPQTSAPMSLNQPLSASAPATATSSQIDMFQSQPSTATSFASLSRGHSHLQHPQLTQQLSPPASSHSLPNSQPRHFSLSQQHPLQQQHPQQHPQHPQQFPQNFEQADFIGVNGVNHMNPAGFPDGSATQTDFQAYQYQLLQQQQQQQQLQQQQQRFQFPPQSIPSNAPPQAMGHFRHQQQFQPKVTSSQSTNDTNWSQEDHLKDSDTSMSSTESNVHQSHLPLSKAKNDAYQSQHSQHSVQQQQQQQQPPSSDDDNSYAAQLLRFFSEDNSQIPYFIHNPPYDFNINEAIDDEGHTPLHWAASIGNYVMIHLLITKGANPLVVNNFGLNPLSKLISFNNCHELKNFPKVLDDLELCLINTDINGRTPLHYLCQFAKVKSKYESLHYYLGIILAKLTALSNNSTTASSSVNLLKNVLDHQDVNGDTCLHLAARAGCGRLVKFLLSYGTRDDLINVNNETAKTIIVNSNLISYGNNGKNGDHQELQQQLQPAQPIVQSNQHQDSQQGQARVSSSAATSTIANGSKRHESSGLATPIQPRFANGGNAETPDTQRTTVQDDDLDDEESSSSRDRVNKEQLAHLMKNESMDSDHHEQHQSVSIDDNKENIFMDDGFKSYEPAVSTPKSQNNSFYSGASHSSHQPLAVISERTAESTPVRPSVAANNTTGTNHINGNTAVAGAATNSTSVANEDTNHKGSRKSSSDLNTTLHTYKPKPPKLDDQGRIIEEKDEHDVLSPKQSHQHESAVDRHDIDDDDDDNEDDDMHKLPLKDLTYMINGMVGSLTNTYKKEVKSLNKELKRVSKTIVDKNELNELSMEKVKVVLNRYGFEQFETIEQGRKIISQETEHWELRLSDKESHLLSQVEELQSHELAKLVSTYEETDNERDDDVDDDETRLNEALKLSRLQLERNHLVQAIIEKVKHYSIDPKMYKYRKLISLSCGLKVEDIDGLLDGIEESLMETTAS